MSEVEQEVGPYDPYQHAQALEEEIKSLRDSIADLQEALDFVTKKIPDKHPAISNAWAALERLKARGHYVEEKK